MLKPDAVETAEMAEYRRELRLALARELHDGPIQSLTESVIRLEGYRSAGESAAMQAAISEIEKSVRLALMSLRHMIRELRDEPPDEDAAEKIRLMASRFQASTGVEIAVVVSPVWPALLPSPVALNLLRIVQESVINAIRHGHPERVLIELRRVDDTLTACIADDGDGMTGEAVPGSGLIGMSERAAMLGGKLQVRHLGRGLEIEVEFPMP